MTAALILVAFAGAQSSSQAIPNDPTHGLKLILRVDPTPEPSDSSRLKTCIAHNLPLACISLKITLKHEGKETVLSYSQTCGWEPFTFEIKRPSGGWEPFRRGRQDWICESTVGGYGPLIPGKSYASTLWLGDYVEGPAFSNGQTDTDASTALLSQPGPHIIRVRQAIDGCIMVEPSPRERFLAGDIVVSGPCVGGGQPKHFLDLESNELELK